MNIILKIIVLLFCGLPLAAQSTSNDTLQEVVVTGVMRSVSKANSIVPVELFQPSFFSKNPTMNFFESVELINGVQPQINCNVCNTGDIHINGMEGPYTMILIDGMPIVSGLSTVYGLSCIPNSLIERVELVKGPAAALYGSEAMGGVINIITKSPAKAPKLSIEFLTSSWGELQTDIATSFKFKKWRSLFGLNNYYYQNRIDKNNDGFTDMALQKRTSIFNKWQLIRNSGKEFSIGIRGVFENRWGGQTQWNKSFLGTDCIYGEYINTKRWEILGQYQFHSKHPIQLQWSLNGHQQRSTYGTTSFDADQLVAFLQATYSKQWNKNQHLLAGLSYRYINYDDNTPATEGYVVESKTHLPGIFVQNESEWRNHSLLLGARLDYHNTHGLVFSPRLGYKYEFNPTQQIRLSTGTGYRVVSIFTEDHAALSGARDVVVKEALKPEQSYNLLLQYTHKTPLGAWMMDADLNLFYNYFTNKIIADLDSDPQKIIYDNLNGHATNQGMGVNLSFLSSRFGGIQVGITYMDVYSIDESERTRQLFAPKWTGNFILTKKLPRHWEIDFTNKWNGPMRLPIVPNDYRPEYSPWYIISNLQIKKKWNRIEVYGGVKNIFDFIPKDGILRAYDPFNKTISNEPNSYEFDPSYNYASLQGRRVFLGLHYSF